MEAESNNINKPYEAQLARALLAKESHPYFLLSRGPMPERCSIHGENENLILPVDDKYWVQFPMRTAEDCKCNVIAITKRYYEKYLQEGVLDSTAPLIVNAVGAPNGHREKRIVPVKTMIA